MCVYKHSHESPGLMNDKAIGLIFYIIFSNIIISYLIISHPQVTQCVYKHSRDSPGGLDDVAIGLVNAARDAGSSDNISVVVVIFKTCLSVPQATPGQEGHAFYFF